MSLLVSNFYNHNGHCKRVHVRDMGQMKKVLCTILPPTTAMERARGVVAKSKISQSLSHIPRSWENVFFVLSFFPSLLLSLLSESSRSEPAIDDCTPYRVADPHILLQSKRHGARVWQ